MPKVRAVHHRPKILIAGAGVAGLETLLALRSLLGGTVEIELLAAEPEFVYHPLAVAAPFGLGEVRRIDLAAVAADHDAHLRLGALAAVDAAASVAQTEGGQALAYDFLVVAIGARRWPAIEGALTFTGGEDLEPFGELIGRVRDGTVQRLVFAAATDVGWLLPLYELSLFTATWARQSAIQDLSLTVVTHESVALEAFGRTVSDAVAGLLADSSIELLTGRTAEEFDGRELLVKGGRTLAADAVVALPGLSGPAVHGLPRDAGGFIPTNRYGAVNGADHVYAAGDGTAFPIKHGGVAALQADAVASAIAARLGAVDRARPFVPVLRGMLLTGAEPRYLRAVSNGHDRVSEVSLEPLWWPPAKIAGGHLAPYLAHAGDPVFGRPPLVDRPAPAAKQALEDVRLEEREAVDLLLEMADANARRGSFEFAVLCLDAAEDVGGPLPTKRQEDRRSWAHHHSL